jgi:hypothetical protein
MRAASPGRLAGVIALVAACGSGGDEANPAGTPIAGAFPEGAMLAEPPADIPSPVRDRVVELAREVAKALCERASHCCSMLNTPANRNCVDHAAFVWLYAGYARKDQPTATLTYGFDESLAAQCRSRLKELPRDCSFDTYVPAGEEMPALFGLQSACAGALQVSSDGQPPRQCWQDCIAQGPALACFAGRCELRGAPGQACQGDRGGTCEAGAFCVQSICAEGARMGEACSTTGEPGCVEPFACRGGACELAPRPGDPCQGIGDCGVGLRCVAELESDPIGPGTCAAISSSGKLPCVADWHCAAECVGGYCDPRDHHFCKSPY